MDGYLLIDKPEGCTSRDVCARVGRALGVRTGRRGTRIGHAGTLDPFATGLLIVAVGRATRLLQRMVGHNKRYLVGVQLGVSSTTDDITGDVTPAPVHVPDDALSVSFMQAVVDRVTARTRQVPPAVSAIHIDGTRAWQRVRAGEVVEMPERDVQFHRATVTDVTQRDSGPFITVDVHCSSGTYMRSLARDLGQELGGGGVAATLHRAESGGMRNEDAIALEAVTADSLRPMIEMVDGVPRAVVSPGDAVHITHGRPVNASHSWASGTEVAVVSADQRLLAMGRVALIDGTTIVRPETVFVRPEELQIMHDAVGVPS